MKKSNFPTCSLIISTYNWPDALNLCLKSCLRQTILPNEIIIADDGSKKETKNLVEKYVAEFPNLIQYIWQEDIGFRLSRIRNKAILASKSDYIIQIDGDVILDKFFIEDHLTIAEEKYFVCGSRATLPEEYSKVVLKKKTIKPNRLKIPLSHFLNSFRIPFFTKKMANRYQEGKLLSLRGCNMSFWRKDIVAINGYNENYQGWGHEDAEMVVRLHNVGIKKKYLKFGGIVYHIYHKINIKENEAKNFEMLNTALRNKVVWCENGLQKGD